MSKKDLRPICTCSAYKFPHRVGGKCDGSAFTEYYYTYVRSLCGSCNCNNSNSGCDVSNGAESIKLAECYVEACHIYPSERLPLEFSPPVQELTFPD